MIRKKLQESGRQIRFRAVVAKATQLRELLNSGCRMLHYTGHGNTEFLAFESNQERLCGVMEPLHVERLKNLFQAGGVRTDLVFISSCYSENCGQAFVEAGVRHVVAVKRDESVTAAQQFANQFYDALMSEHGRYTVRHAFDIALNTVNASDNPNAPPQGDNFLLLPRDGDHDVQIFDTLLEGEFVDETRLPPPRPRLVKPVPFYKGLVELQKVVELLVDPLVACVTITGEHGSGKTERAIQACDYVRIRHHFDSVVWADVKRAVEAAVSANVSGVYDVYDDPCRLIGVAAGMPQPGPNSEEELIQFLFKNPTPEGDRQCQQVLLVLEDVDSLFEGGGDARDRLIIQLNSLCSMGEHLKLLVTSEQSLLRDTNQRFRHGAEKVAKVKKLRRRDAAELLVDKVPTRFTKAELGLRSNCTRDDILDVLMAHPVLEAADGHPGTLLRLAPLLEDLDLNDGRVLQRARRHRLEYLYEASSQRLRASSRASSTTSLASEVTGGGNGVNVNGDGGGLPNGASDVGLGVVGPTPGTPTNLHHAFSHDTHLMQHQNGHQGNNFPDPSMVTHAGAWGGGGGAGAGAGQHPLLAGAGMNGFSGVGGGAHAGGSGHPNHTQHHRRHSAHPASPTRQPTHPQRRMTVHDHRMALEELGEPDPPTMTAEEKRAWDTARTAGLIDRGCRLVWVKASANAAASGWRFSTGSGGGGGEGGGSGWAMGGGGAGGGEAVARYDCVPWEYLREGLKQHLCGQLTIPSNQDAVLDEGPYSWIHDEFGAGGGAGAMGQGDGYGAVNTPQVRGMNEAELAFVRGVLKAKQEKVRNLQEKRRQQRAFDSGEMGPAGGVAFDGPVDGGGSDDVIPLEAFLEFSLWWAPLMRTLSLLRNDWASMAPVRVHGFISRLVAERKLQQKERGTFLLRFSESMQGTLVVSFTEHVTHAPGGSSMMASPPSSAFSSPPTTCVKHCLVDVQRGGRCFIEVEQGKTVPYDSLHDLVRACSSMQTLYPDVPKGEAFYESGSLGPGRSVSDISMHPPEHVRGSGDGPRGRGGGTGGAASNVFTLEEWGSRPIDMALVEG
eukprot:g2344.t1